MLMLSWIFKLNKYIFYFFIRPPPVLKYPDSKSCLLIKQLSVTSNSYICSGHARIGTDAKEHKVFASES